MFSELFILGKVSYVICFIEFLDVFRLPKKHKKIGILPPPFFGICSFSAICRADGMGLVILCHRSSKSTFGGNIINFW